MVSNKIKARVFISCGQNKDSDEVGIAREIAARISGMGFEPYVAVQEQTLRGIKENIFPRIENSEYFIFIDFKREKVGSGKYRGSLFSHQELAIATFLDKEVISFQEHGVKKDDGLLGTIQANSITFSDKQFLHVIIADRIKELGWDPNWRSELTLERSEIEYNDAYNIPHDEHRRWYYIDVKNFHRQKIAVDCAGYLHAIRNISTGKEKILAPVELRWRGLHVPRVIIPPTIVRNLDAFFVPHRQPNKVYFGINRSLIGFLGYIEEYSVTGPGAFELDYIVFSANFHPTRDKFILEIGKSLDDIKFYKKIGEAGGLTQ